MVSLFSDIVEGEYTKINSIIDAKWYPQQRFRLYPGNRSPRNRKAKKESFRSFIKNQHTKSF